MLWKLKGKTMKTPSMYKDSIEDIDNDSYTSKVTGALIDNVLAQGMLKLEMAWDYCTEDEAEELLQATYENPMIITVKCPSVKGGMITAPFRCAKRSCEMYVTGNDEDTYQSKWNVSFQLMQKELVDSQKGGEYVSDK